MAFMKRVAEKMATKQMSKSAEKMAEQLKIIDKRLTTIQENQVEFEDYLKKILSKLKNDKTLFSK